MRKVRPRTGFETAPNNVIPISSAARRRQELQRPILYYLSDSGCWLDALESTCLVSVVDIDSPEQLKHRLLTTTPDIIFIESEIEWAEPIATIEWLIGLIDAPVVVICEPGIGPDFVKGAYAAGAHDMLHSPLGQDDVLETLAVLLKLRRTLSEQV